MLIFILNILRAHWRGIIACMLTAVIAVQHIGIGRLNNELMECRVKNLAFADANRRLALAVQSQNDAIAGLHKASGKKRRKAAGMLASAKKSAARYGARARTIEAYKAPAGPCRGVLTLLNNYKR